MLIMMCRCSSSMLMTLEGMEMQAGHARPEKRKAQEQDC
jgi:hypothetical protein